MRRSGMLAVGAVAAVLALRAQADDPARGSKQEGIEDPARVGRPGETTDRTRGTPDSSAQPRELSGKVVKADGKTLYLEHMGAVVPLKIDEKTQFSGEGVKSGRDLTEGQEVRASFTVKDETTNVAEQITVASASGQESPAGGSGRPERTPRGQHPQIPPERGPGVPPDRLPVPRDPSNPRPDESGSVPVPPKY